MSKINYAVINYEQSQYGTCCVLKGIYPSKEEALFISRCVKKNEKLKYYPKVVETSNAPTATGVGDYLRREEKRKNDKENKIKREEGGHYNSPY